MNRDSVHAPSFLLLLAILIFIFFTKLSALPIRIWDEARNADNALHMYLHGNWLVTYYDGVPDMWNTKPPLLIWLQVISMHVFGINEWAIRFPCAAASVATGLFLYRFVSRHVGNPWAGFMAGLVLATTFGYVYYHTGRTGDYDALMTFFATSFCLSFFNYITSLDRRWFYAFWGFLTLAALTKGIAGLLLLPGLFLFALLQRKTLYILRRPDFYIGLASFVLVIGGYYLLREKYNPGYLEAVRQNELGGRYLTTLEENRHPFLYYVKMLTRYRYKDWAVFIIPAWVVGFYHSNYTIRKITLFTLLCAVSFELIISSAATKLSWYDLPVYPFLAIQLGVFFYIVWQWIKPFVERSRIPSFIVAAVLIGILVRVPFLRAMDHIYRFKEPPPEVESHKQGYFLQDQIKKNKDFNNYTFCFDEYYGQLSFYVDKLKTQHVDVNLKKSVDSLPPGRMVVVSLEKQKNELLQKYKVDSVESGFGCTVYRVKAPIP